MAGINYKFTVKVKDEKKSSIVFTKVWKKFDGTFEVSMFNELKITDSKNKILFPLLITPTS